MERLTVTPRDNWREECEKVGFLWHTISEPGIDPVYWDESHAYSFTSEEVDEIEFASAQLYRMCMMAVDEIIANNLMGRMGIPAEYHPMIIKSWERQDIDIYGRFDFAYGVDGNIKMLEFNADTPTSLLEASVVQWNWLEEFNMRNGVNYDQFNSIHEQLIEAFSGLKNELESKLYFASVMENTEDYGTTTYIRDCAMQAGIITDYIDMENIGWNGSYFTDMDENKIDAMFKLYPWEWLVREEFGKFLMNDSMKLLEPAWKLILSNKGILPILWDMFPNHPNLLPAYWDRHQLGGNFVEKPMLAREGADVKIFKNGVLSSAGVSRGYDELASSIYQEYLPMPKFDGMTPVIGSWIVSGMPCGMGIREDINEITGNSSHFVPHFFKD